MFSENKKIGDEYQKEIVNVFRNSKAKNLEEYPIKSDAAAHLLTDPEDIKNYKIQKEYGDFSLNFGHKNIFYDTSRSTYLPLTKLHERKNCDYFIHKISGKNWVIPKWLLNYCERESWYIKEIEIENNDGIKEKVKVIDLEKVVGTNCPRRKSKLLSEHIKEMEAI